MAQISEKRAPLPHGRTHASGAMTRTKENSNSAKYSGGKGVEILDFHESWLEEVELYKDKMFVCKQYPHQHHHHHHHNNNHLSTHNYLSSLNCCHNENGASQNSRIGGTGNTGAAVGVVGGTTKKSESAQENSKTMQVNSRRRMEKPISTASGKSRVVIRSPPKSNNTAVNNIIHTEPYKKVQMLLKRARDEAYAKHVAHNKRSNTTSHHSQSQSQSTAKTGSNAATHNQKTGSAAPSTTTVTSSQKSPNKIVVNTFHASSLLSAQHHENDKTNFLTQNGLTKSAASALETSLYASLYTPQVGSSVPHYNSIRLNSGEQASYVGVSMHKVGGENDRNRYGHGHGHAEEDPCAAIDDVNNYDDSDSDEDYAGCPFYLEEDGTETRQSRNIRFQLDDITSNISIGTNDSENSVYFKPTSILSASLFPNVPPYLNFTSHADKGPSMPPALHRVLKWKLSPVMPKIVKRVVLNSGFRIIKNTTDWMAVWEKHMKSPGFRTIRSHQKYNHIPGSFRIGRKDTMWRSIHNNMKKFGKKEFGFMQKSYIMPDDLENLRQVWPKNASKLTKWIVKPPASARGTGIRIVNKWSQFPKDRPLVVQKYIERPLLINDNKFDMRLYVVLTSINPLRIYMYKDGLARFASVKYSSELSNLDERCMHLTNYSINKFSQNYTKNEDFNACQGHKWTLQSLWSCLENRGVNTKRLWATLRNLIIKAIVSGESGLNRMYRQNVNFRYNCFELFGFDVLLDENLVPWLLEINISPSLHSELPLDLHVKGPLIQAVLNTALYQVPPKLSEKQQREILDELNIKGPLCHDKRIFTTCLTAEEVRKHNQFTNRSIEYREEYIDTILDNMLPDDVRCLLVAEDELARCKPLERVFPTADTHIYLRFVENPRYYNRLLDAWEHKYSQNREKGLALLRKFCKEGYHLQVSDAALEKEPNVALTEIDMLHVRKDEPLDAITNIAVLKNIANVDISSTTITQDITDVKWKNDSTPGSKEPSVEPAAKPT